MMHDALKEPAPSARCLSFMGERQTRVERAEARSAERGARSVERERRARRASYRTTYVPGRTSLRVRVHCWQSYDSRRMRGVMAWLMVMRGSKRIQYSSRFTIVVSDCVSAPAFEFTLTVFDARRSARAM